jgi:Stress responsive A/B Barrel Domain
MAIVSSGFVHTVFFWLKENNNQAHTDALKDGLKRLATISEIKTAYIGAPADTKREVIDSSYSFSITFVFDNAKDQEIYQTHPDHLLFIEKCSYLWERVQVYDAC